MHTVMMCPAAAASRRTAFGAVVGCSLLALAAAGLDEQGKMPEGVIGLYPSSFDMQVSNGSAWVVEFYAPWCHRCKEMAPTMGQLASNLQAESDANLSYAVAIVDAEENIALGLRFLVLQYPTLYAVCGRHVTPLKKRGAEGLTGEVHAWAITNCRDGGSYMPPTDVPALKEAFNPLSPMSVWHTVSFTVLGLTTMPLASVTPFGANVALVSILAMLWLMPVVMPLVGLLIKFCDSDDDKEKSQQQQQPPAAKAEEKKAADQPNPAAAEPKKDK